MGASYVLKSETTLTTFTGLVSGIQAQELIEVMANDPSITPSLDEFGLQASPQPTPDQSAASGLPRAHPARRVVSAVALAGVNIPSHQNSDASCPSSFECTQHGLTNLQTPTDRLPDHRVR
mgnify:FL=1